MRRQSNDCRTEAGLNTVNYAEALVRPAEDERSLRAAVDAMAALGGQPGQDQLYGNGGDDVIDARDGFVDFVIQCGRGIYIRPPRKPKEPPPEPILHGTPAGRALTDSFDPPAGLCTDVVIGEPVDGLNNSG